MVGSGTHEEGTRSARILQDSETVRGCVWGACPSALSALAPSPSSGIRHRPRASSLAGYQPTSSLRHVPCAPAEPQLGLTSHQPRSHRSKIWERGVRTLGSFPQDSTACRVIQSSNLRPYILPRLSHS